MAVQVRDVFGNPIEVGVSKKIDKRGRRTSPSCEPVREREEIPIKLKEVAPKDTSGIREDLLTLMRLTRNARSISLKKDAEDFTRRIEKIRNWERLYPKVKEHLEKHPNYSVMQAINFCFTGGKTFWVA